VFTLVDKDGKALKKVLKIGHTDLAHTLVLNKFAASMMDLRHEWELGIHLMAVLRDENGYLPGFTQTFDACLSKKDGKYVFRGMILEQINGECCLCIACQCIFLNVVAFDHRTRYTLCAGYPVRKRLEDPTFHNIRYVREMLFQLLSALDRGQRTVGFTHADMGLGNVMEHYPETFPEGEVKSGSDIPGFVESGSGGTLPLGPKLEFKIIDYGLTELNGQLAATAGGVTPEDTVRKIEEQFSSVNSEAVEGDSTLIGPGADTRSMKETKNMTCQWNVHFSKDDANLMFLAPKIDRASGDTVTEKLNLNGARGNVEKLYRRFWARKGDVFHLLLALGTILNERVWRKEDQHEVMMLASLVYHVTGVKMTTYFATPDDPKSPKVMGRKDKNVRIYLHNCFLIVEGCYEPETSMICLQAPIRPAVVEDDDDIYGKRKATFGCFSRSHMFYWAHRHPFNSGLLAGEALVSPFFGCSPPHAEPLADIKDVFKK